jgi:kynurenine formamidase
MIRTEIEFSGQHWVVDLETPHDLAVPLAFDGPQPNHLGAEPARMEPMRAEGFIGDVARGGSCNAPVVHQNVHCNGTHTECVGHLTAGLSAVGDIVIAPRPAMVISLDIEDGDAIGGEALTEILERLPDAVDALVVRTLPNPLSKMERVYEASEPHAWFSVDAMRAIVDAGITHLICDLPSVDAYDDAVLASHRVFWALPPDGVIADAGVADRPDATITELAFIPDAVPDGLYWLDLGVPRFLADAAPSRPIIYPLRPRP